MNSPVVGLIFAVATLSSPALMRYLPVEHGGTKPFVAFQTKLQPARIGEWGGREATLVVASDRTNLEFGCASGIIPERLKTDKSGKFRVEGTYTRRAPGPIRAGITPKSEPVIYSGRISGRSMTLEMDFPNSERPSLSFQLTRGTGKKPPKCY